jgi:hypothetical protein
MAFKQCCNNCLLRIPQRKGAECVRGFCTWFLKKLEPAKPIPEHIFDVGCARWKPGKTAKEEASNA